MSNIDKKSFLIGVLLTCTVVFGVAAFKPYGYIASKSFSVGSVSSSADGMTVYLADLTGVQKSADGGKTWIRLLSSEEVRTLTPFDNHRKR